ncbi:conserved hypothetical protein [Shewanella sediminis HAW-EB3]|uniref:Uncharacterized protein n=1 Tax=Shewanella sediminis (strain HAW-EB3) TaxID=425104 RepID=A8FTC0_SHESH|nr:hypothetical protein [Shewanella sediminis]ABV36093.1 conserved hypothetical protein [Shewanella sediminis HAW-EB3]
MRFDKKMDWLEKVARNVMLFVGISGVLVIYCGFLFLLFSGRDTTVLPWYLLISPWVCIYFGLTQAKQLAVIEWFKHKIVRKK